jgi:ATP-binding cassette subfamily G (WHITE) protein 2 (SNQ2)
MPAINVFAKENKERKALNEELEKNKEAFRKGDKEQDLSGLIQTKKPFTWEDLTFVFPFISVSFVGAARLTFSPHP